MKRTLAFILAAILVLMLAGCHAEAAKKDILELVSGEYDAIAAACVNQDSDALLGIDGITQVNIVDGYVLVYCKGSGIAPSSQDYGFYYSVKNQPVAVDCNLNILCDTGRLTPEGNGYQYIDSGNVFYTEHMEGNLYFFSTAY